MFQLTFELLLCALVVCLAFLYVRDRYRDLRARCREWLRQQRVVAAATVVGPSATPNPKPTTPPNIPKPVPPMADVTPQTQPVCTRVPSIVDTLDFAQLDVPTCIRRRGVRPAPGTVAKSEAAKRPSHLPIGNEELVAYPQITAAYAG